MSVAGSIFNVSIPVCARLQGSPMQFHPDVVYPYIRINGLGFGKPAGPLAIGRTISQCNGRRKREGCLTSK